VQSSSQIITTNKSTPSFLQAGCPSCHPTDSSMQFIYNNVNKQAEIQTHGRSNGRHWKVVVVEYVAHKQEVQVAPMCRQYQYWILVNQLPQLTNNITISHQSEDG